ncbi:hypothetical protein VIGAN_10084700 [Vigna angularis var. angularis]|uniref:Uncharacterized protein n=1 Tax=Vigna angularis var. angularis TaxID=157739 RepID=A0A0S3T306_PHAAN|nr:hypothetical protein VIGAN_10084700 [Vigna angularis var. angularis]
MLPTLLDETESSMSVHQLKRNKTWYHGIHLFVIFLLTFFNQLIILVSSNFTASSLCFLDVNKNMERDLHFLFTSFLDVLSFFQVAV